jgi:glycosyltransferase involved in cell wall biosynthesis
VTPAVDLTVAICTWNRAALLGQTLDRLAAVELPPGTSWEVLVVNNNSTDHTDRVLAAYLPTGKLPLRTATERKQGLSNARNCALELAAGRWVIWTDDDVRPDPTWLTGFYVTTLRHPLAAAIGGPIRPWFPTPPDPDLMAAFKPLRVGFCGVDHGPIERELLPDEQIYGANMAYRTDAVRGLTFDPALGRNGETLAMHEDTVYLRQVRDRGGRVVWSPAMSLEHYVDPHRMTVEYARRFCLESHPPADPTADPSPRLAGAPRWLWRKAASAGIQAAVNCRPGRRKERLTALVDLWSARGQIAAHRAGRPEGA